MPVIPGSMALLSNPTSGKGRGASRAVAALGRLRAAREVDSLQGRDADEALALARQAVADGIETLVVCGGDGMVHLGVQAVAGTDTRLGVIPAGTGNDVGRYLGLPRKDPVQAAEVVLAGREERIDLARVRSETGDTYYTTVLSCGFDAIVNERANAMTWPKGQMRYNLSTIAELGRLAPIPYVLHLDDDEVRLDATMVGVANGPSFGGGLRIAEGADLGDGLLDVVVIAPLSRGKLLRTYPKLFKGTHVHEAAFSRHRVSKVSVAAPGIVAYADGERIGPLPLTVESAPGALRVLVA